MAPLSAYPKSNPKRQQGIVIHRHVYASGFNGLLGLRIGSKPQASE